MAAGRGVDKRIVTPAACAGSRGVGVFQTVESSETPRPRAHLPALIGLVGLCELVGLANGAVTASSVKGWYLSLATPPGTPPNWLFGPVWTVLYLLIGIAAWLVWRRPAIGQRRALQIWGWQLLANAVWPSLFFGLHSPALGMAAILLLLAMVVVTIRAFAPISRPAALLLLPYAAWTCYAGYLNAGFLWLNPG